MEREHFGYSLRQARLKAGRSLDDIARRTKISSANLEHLEGGDRAALPAEVFVCGYLRAYARELGLSGDEAVARYRQTAAVVHPCDSADPAVAAPAVEVVPGPGAEGQGGPTLQLAARLRAMLDGEGRVPSYALVVLLVVLVATITLSLLLGGDPSPGRGLS